MWIVFSLFPSYFHELLYLTSLIKVILSWDKSLGNWEILLSSRVSFHQKTIHVWPLFFMFTSKIQSDSITAHNHYFSSCSLPKYTHSSLPVRSWSSGEFEVCRTAVTWKKKYENLFFCQQVLKRCPFPLITTIIENIFKPYQKPCRRYCIYRLYIL